MRTFRPAPPVLGLILALLPQGVSAYPEGAPWGAADRAETDHCASCHWERSPQYSSASITLAGLPDKATTSQRYSLILSLKDSAMKISGFQVIAIADGQPAGQFIVAAQSKLETAALGTMVRSTAPAAALAERVRWRFQWHAPSLLRSPIVFLIAVSAANDDGSPFGDTIHYRRIEVPVAH
ncbi:MAG: choice-of-anchor V domain-containing protein [Pseudomonadota bacterium]